MRAFLTVAVLFFTAEAAQAQYIGPRMPTYNYYNRRNYQVYDQDGLYMGRAKIRGNNLYFQPYTPRNPVEYYIQQEKRRLAREHDRILYGGY